MNKIYSFLALGILTAAGALAQPTITSSAMPQVGYVYSMGADTFPADLATFTVSAGSASAQTWNYSAEFANIYGETTTFQAPSAGAGNSNFPSATLAVAQSNGTDWVYFLGNSGGLYVDGAYVNAQGNMIALDLTPNSLFMATPSTYGYNNNAQSTATATVMIGTNLVQLRHWADRTVTADAFGSLTTPTGTYPNTLRVKAYEVSIDSIFLDVFGTWNFMQRQTDTTTNYNWLQNSSDAQLMEINMDKTGAVTKASYLISFSNGVGTINEPSTAFGVYPNPSSQVSYLTYINNNSGYVSLQMFDVNGRKVGDLLGEDQAIGKQKVMINLESMHLPKGLYMLRLQNGDGIQTIKLSVN